MDKDFRAGFASYTFSILFANFTKFAVTEITKILEVNSELRKLDRMLLKIQAMIDTIEDGRAAFPVNILSDSWIAWLEEANRLIYDVRDLIEDVSLKLGHRKGDKLEAADLIKELMVSVPHKVSAFVKELQDLAKEMETAFFVDLMKKQDLKLVVRKQYYEFCGSVSQTLMIGRADQLKKVTKILTETDVAICITGMAGIGKSVFAQCLCNEVKESYPLKIWVSSFVEFDLVKIMRSVIESVSGKSCDLMDPGLLRTTLLQLLQENPSILVLDDFDTEDYEVWSILCEIFDVGSKQRRVIITTRNSKLSSLVGANIFCLPTLSDDACWKIMKQRPFLNNQLHNLEEIIELAKKCSGLPIIAKTLGDVLHCLPDQEWDSILQCNLWGLHQFKNYVVPNMLLSYCSLPPYLKKCFSYCSLFPPRFEYDMNKIVLLWMAEGLIRPISGRRIEDVGREYFKELIYRSFFSSTNEDPHDFSGLYKMHDSTHHMALLVSSSICQYSGDKESSYSVDNVRHLSMCHDSESVDLQKLAKSDKLLTFLWLCANDVYIGQQISVLFEHFQILRVLDLESSGITEVSDLVGEFKYLRYLNLSDNSISTLPESLCNLSRLQVLILKNCTLLNCLPKDFCRLTELRHFQFDLNNQIHQMPINFRFLVHMQSLGAYIVGANEGCKIEELMYLSFLSGSICISGLENINSQEQAATALLNDKQGISKLELEWRSPGVVDIQKEVLAGLQPHESLEELIISNYCGESFLPWLSDGHCCQLKIVHLRRCQRCDALPLLGKLQFLEHLVIERMSSLETVCTDFVGFGDFPSLKSLSFIDMPELVNWETLGWLCMRQLRDLKFSNCPKLVSLPLLRQLKSLQNLEISGSERLNILPRLPYSLRSIVIWDCPILKSLSQVGGAVWNQVKVVSSVLIDGVEIHTMS